MINEPDAPPASRNVDSRIPGVADEPLRAALTQATQALDAAEASRRPVEMVQALAQVARCYRALAEPVAAESFLQQALRWARTLGAVDASVELLCDAAGLAADIAQATTGDDNAARRRAARDRARDHCFQAVGLVRQCADPQWEVTVLLRVSDVLDRCGDHEDAISLQCRAVHLIARQQMSAVAEPQIAAPSMTM